jgi:hypothetical protein
VDAALAEVFPEDGMQLHLRPLVLEGYREAITDQLIDCLESSAEADSRRRRDTLEKSLNALEVLYYLHGTVGYYIVPGMVNPRPENASPNEPITVRQMDRLIRSALRQEARLANLEAAGRPPKEREEGWLLRGYLPLFDTMRANIPDNVLTTENRARLREYCEKLFNHPDLYKDNPDLYRSDRDRRECILKRINA